MSSDISVSTTDNGGAFLSDAKSWLNLNEPANNTILSIAAQAGSPQSLLRPPYWFGLAKSNGAICGAAAHAIPDGLVLSRMTKQIVGPLVRSLVSEGVQAARIYAPAEIADIAAEEITALTGITFQLQREWVSFVVQNFVVTPDPKLGVARAAMDSDLAIVESFGVEYGREKPAIVNVARYLVSKLSSGDVHLWVDSETDKVTTIVATAGQTDSVVRIAAVFTPRAFRGKGHASAAVATVTNSKLKSGVNAVTLTVDGDDIRALRLYQSLGYRPLQSNAELVSNDYNQATQVVRVK